MEPIPDDDTFAVSVPSMAASAWLRYRQIAARQVALEGVYHRFCRQKGIGRTVGDGWVYSSEFTEILEVLYVIRRIECHDY